LAWTAREEKQYGREKKSSIVDPLKEKKGAKKEGF